MSQDEGFLCLEREKISVSRGGGSFSQEGESLCLGRGISLSPKGGIFLSKERSYPWTEEGRNFNVFEGSLVTWFVVDIIWFIYGP